VHAPTVSTVIFLNAGPVLGCTIVYGVEEPAIHYPMVATVGATANLFLVLELSHPYVGEMATSSALCLRSSGSPTPN
jgi:hypothetical protein